MIWSLCCSSVDIEDLRSLTSWTVVYALSRYRLSGHSTAPGLRLYSKLRDAATKKSQRRSVPPKAAVERHSAEGVVRQKREKPGLKKSRRIPDE